MSHVSARRRFLFAIVAAVAALASVGASAPVASAAIFECVNKTTTACITFSGYNGTSTWGYPVDGTGNNCTNYAAFRAARNGAGNPGNLGNAGSWATNARNKGIAVNSTPAVGAIAQWNYRSAYAPRFGHVAYVESINGGEISLSDSNWELGSKRWRVSPGDPLYPDNFIHLRDVPQGNDPFGAYDVASGGAGEIRVSGWTIDNDAPTAATQVHVYVGGPAGSAGAEGHPLVANVSRPDVDAVHHKGAAHGFDATFATAKRGTTQACAYAITLGGGNNVLLGCKTVVVTDPNPFGAYDELSAPAAGGQVRVRGWSIDPSARTTATAVHIYIGGPAGSAGAEGNAITANTSRPDVDAVHHAGANHGYDATLTTAKRGATQVCAYAINLGAGDNVGLGCKTVTIGAPAAKPVTPTPSLTVTNGTKPPTTTPTTPSAPLNGTAPVPDAGAATRAPAVTCTVAEAQRRRGRNLHISCSGSPSRVTVTFTPHRRGRAPRTVDRPVSAGSATAGTKRLKPGKYDVTLTVGGVVVGTSALRIR